MVATSDVDIADNHTAAFVAPSSTATAALIAAARSERDEQPPCGRPVPIGGRRAAQRGWGLVFPEPGMERSGCKWAKKHTRTKHTLHVNP